MGKMRHRKIAKYLGQGHTGSACSCFVHSYNYYKYNDALLLRQMASPTKKETVPVNVLVLQNFSLEPLSESGSV